MFRPLATKVVDDCCHLCRERQEALGFTQVFRALVKCKKVRMLQEGVALPDHMILNI